MEEGGFFEKTKRGRGRAKHAILDGYLKSWLSIMGQSWYGTAPLVYIDGFAGPGTYKPPDSNVAEIGSPIVAYNAAVNHTLLAKFRSSILMFFVEKDPNHAMRLKATLDQLANTKEAWIREKVQYLVVCGEFADKLEIILGYDCLASSAMLVFADPFGYKGIPNLLLRRLLNRNDPSGGHGRVPTELFVTVMDGFARRFISETPQGAAIAELMGPEDNWHHLTIRDAFTAEERRVEFLNVYIQNLTSELPGSRTLKFGMRDKFRNRYVYHLLFVTTHHLGIRNMKASMYKESDLPLEMVFSEFRENRDGPAPPKKKDEIVKYVTAQIKGKYAGIFVSGKSIADWICDETVVHLNFKNELKRELVEYQRNPGVRKFDEIVYEFPGLEPGFVFEKSL